jgi:hypothetical protein
MITCSLFWLDDFMRRPWGVASNRSHSPCAKPYCSPIPGQACQGMWSTTASKGAPDRGRGVKTGAADCFRTKFHPGLHKPKLDYATEAEAFA